MSGRSACPLLALGAALALAPPAAALSFGEAPALPALTAVKLNGGARSTNTTMTNFSVSEAAGETEGWSVTVAGQSGLGKSAVFAQFCTGSVACGVEGYLAKGLALPAGSLTLSTAGASFTGGTGTVPSLLCGGGCAVDGASAEKVASRAAGVSLGGTWTTTGFSGASLQLRTASTLRALPAGDVYRVNVVWTLSTGP